MRTIVGELPVEAGSIRLAPHDATIAWLPQVLPDAVGDAARLRPTSHRGRGRRRRARIASAAIASGSRVPTTATPLPSSGGSHSVRPTSTTACPRSPPGWVSHVDPTRPIGTLSGGQAARASLVAVLLSHYDVLLLDEPTNDLDARGLDLMADFVRSHDGPVLIASHDRAFLDTVATSVVELDLAQGRIGHYTGSWSDYVDQRALERAHAWEAYEGYAAERDSLLAQSRQRRDWAAKGRRNVAMGKEPDKHLRERHKARADRQAAKGARLERAAGRLDAVDAAAQGVAAALHDHRGTALGRRRRDAVRGGRRAARLPAGTGEPRRRPRRAHRRRR